MKTIKIKIEEWEDIPLSYKHDPDFLLSWHNFIEMRKKKKCVTTSSIEVMILKKMLKWSKGRAMAALNISTINSWQWLFEDRDYVEKKITQGQIY